MKFFVLLISANVSCFLPLYLLNLRDQPNPFQFLCDSGIRYSSMLRLLYSRKRYTDPFRVNVDYTICVLLAGYFGLASGPVTAGLAVMLAVGFLLTVYASTMHLVFKRPPSLAGDLSLLRTGWSVAHRWRFLVLAVATVCLVLVFRAAEYASLLLLAAAPAGHPLLLVLAALLPLPALYNWRPVAYSEFIWRVGYSPLLHLYRNLEYGRRVRRLVTRDARQFASLNEYQQVELERRPNIVLLCIESYGDIVFRDAEIRADNEHALAGLAQRSGEGGFHAVSSLSAAPIFSGGSWLSFASFTYGIRFDDVYVHDYLFGRDGPFQEYESAFHVLERNGYSNNLLCPIGGVAARYVDWDALNRCFRPQRRFDFEDLDYTGPLYDFFVPRDLYVAPDQYALNFAYDSLKQTRREPFSLFFCTLNSHYPWQSVPRVVADWRQLNNPGPAATKEARSAPMKKRYAASIACQLDYLARFLESNADDYLIVIAFGDHQPPMITPEAMGSQTPVHVFSSSPEFVEVFRDHGFRPGTDLDSDTIDAMRHEGFLSLFVKALDTAFGRDGGAAVEYRPSGTSLYDGV
jgi:hypothetical protein